MYGHYPRAWTSTIILPIDGPLADWFTENYPEGFDFVAHDARDWNFWGAALGEESSIFTFKLRWRNNVAQDVSDEKGQENIQHIVIEHYMVHDVRVSNVIFCDSEGGKTSIITDNINVLLESVRQLKKNINEFLDYADSEMQNIEDGIV